MKVIYTITPNPVLDLSGKIVKLIPNEKNYVTDETRMAGGNGINVARVAHSLGSKVEVSGFIGGSTGQEIKDFLRRKNIHYKFVMIEENTRINLTISNLKTHEQTRFSFPGPHILPKEKKLLQKYILSIPPSSIVVFGGSLPHQFSPKEITTLIKKLNQKKSFCIVDMPGQILKKVIQARPFLIKPNLIEFQELTKQKVKTIQEILSIAKNMTKLVPVICISSVENGALLVTENNCWFGTIPKVKIYSTVGAGDSMVGSFVSEFSSFVDQNKELGKNELLQLINIKGDQLLKKALAAACATLTQPGMELANKKNIEKFYSKIKIRSVKTSSTSF